MNHRSFLFVFLFLFGSFSPLYSQSSGREWMDYPTVSDIQDIAEDGDYLWFAGLGGLIKLNRTTLESEVFTRVNSGLPSLGLTTVAVDKQGDLWVGTLDRGVAHFDGTVWTVHSTSSNFLAHDHVNEITVTSDSSVWIATPAGVTRYRNGIVTVYHHDEYPWLSTVAAITESKPGTIWFGCANGYGGGLPNAPFYRLENEQWIDSRNIAPGYEQISSIAYYKEVLWFANRQCYSGRYGSVCAGNVVSYDGDTPRGHGLMRGDFPVTTLAFDSTGTMWCAYHGYPGLLRYDNTLQEIPIEGGATWWGVNAMLTDSDGILWIAGATGVWRYNGVEWKTFSYFGNPYPAPHEYIGFLNISVMTVDTNQSIWLGYWHENAPVVHFTGTHWFHYPSYSTAALAIDKKGVKWRIASGSSMRDKALYRLDGNDWSMVDDRKFNHIYIDRDNRLWAGIEGGVAVYDGSGWTNYTSANSGIPGTCIAVTQSPNGAMWFATKGGLTRFHNNSWENYLPPSGKGEDMTLLVSDSTGNIWCSSRNYSYLLQFNGSDWISHTSFGDSFQLTEEDEVSALIVDNKGKVWTAIYNTRERNTDRGTILAFFDGEEWKSHTHQNSPISSIISSLAVDAHNNLWIGSDAGLMVYREGGVVTSAQERVSVQTGVSLMQNRPNPVSALTTISYSVQTGASQQVQLKIYNVLSAEIATLVDRVQQPGEYSVEFDTSTLPPGVYYYQLQTAGATTSRQMVVVR